MQICSDELIFAKTTFGTRLLDGSKNTRSYCLTSFKRATKTNVIVRRRIFGNTITVGKCKRKRTRWPIRLNCSLLTLCVCLFLLSVEKCLNNVIMRVCGTVAMLCSKHTLNLNVFRPIIDSVLCQCKAMCFPFGFRCMARTVCVSFPKCG